MCFWEHSWLHNWLLTLRSSLTGVYCSLSVHLWFYSWLWCVVGVHCGCISEVSVSDKVLTLQFMTLMKLTIGCSYTADLQIIWHVTRRVKMWFTPSPQADPEPEEVLMKTEAGLSFPHLGRSDVIPSCLQQLKLKPLPCGLSITLLSSSSAWSRDAIACWAIFHEETSTLPAKCCFSLRVLIYTVWLWEIQLRGKWALGLAGRRHMQYV